jgi:hypothetical protein
MGTVTLDIDQIVEVDVVTDTVDEPRTPLDVWFADDELVDSDTDETSRLVYLRGPDEVLHDLHAIHAPKQLLDEATPVLAGQVTTTYARAGNLVGHVIGYLRSNLDSAQITDRRRVYRRVPVVAAAAPPNADSTVKVEISASAAREGGLKLKLGGFGLTAKVRHTITTTPKLECDAGQAKIASLYIPLDRVTSMVRPEGGRERFGVVHYEPVADLRRVGTVTSLALVEELLESGTGAWAPLGGSDATTKGSMSERVEVAVAFEIGRKFGEQHALSLTAELSGKAELKVDYSLPAATSGYALNWVHRPDGACVVPR